MARLRAFRFGNADLSFATSRALTARLTGCRLSAEQLTVAKGAKGIPPIT
jgi:hypothetical protein